MAPNGETLMATAGSRSSHYGSRKPQRLLMEGLQRAMSNLSFELGKAAVDDPARLPPASAAEVEEAECECCGMSEECTPEYIRRVRERFCRRWVCGLCSEAVKEEMGKNGGRREEALAAHTGVCARFNRVERTHPVLYQAAAMREILKKYCSKKKGPGGIVRSSSCIPAITREMNEQ